MERVERKQKPLPAVCNANMGVIVEFPKSYGEKPSKDKLFDRAAIGITLILFVISFIIIQSLPTVAFFFWDMVPLGNTTANLSAGAFAAESDGWTYLADTKDSVSGLYKVKPETSESKLLTKGMVSSINVMKGRVYYILTEGDKSSLYKIPVEGGDPTLMK